MGLNLKEPLAMVKEEVNNGGFRETGVCMFFSFAFFPCLFFL